MNFQKKCTILRKSKRRNLLQTFQSNLVNQQNLQKAINLKALKEVHEEQKKSNHLRKSSDNQHNQQCLSQSMEGNLQNNDLNQERILQEDLVRKSWLRLKEMWLREVQLQKERKDLHQNQDQNQLKRSHQWWSQTCLIEHLKLKTKEQRKKKMH